MDARNLEHEGCAVKRAVLRQCGFMHPPISVKSEPCPITPLARFSGFGVVVGWLVAGVLVETGVLVSCDGWSGMRLRIGFSLLASVISDPAPVGVCSSEAADVSCR